MTNDQLYLIPNTLYNTGHTRGKPGQAGGCPGDAFRKFAKWTLKFPGNFHGNGNFWKFPEIPEVRSSFPGKTPPINTEQRLSPLKLALAFSTQTSSLSEARGNFTRPPAPLLLGGIRLG